MNNEMKVCGFTFVRNAIKYDYPVVESIKSILPVCDEVLVLVGNSDDDTLALIESIDSPKIKIAHSIWDDSLRKNGAVLAVETNKAFDLISDDYKWAFYIQADEVVHEKYHKTIRKSMQKYQNEQEIDGLLFNYKHFYGTYNYIGDSRDWYRREIRIIKNDKNIRSYRDAQGFRKNNNKLKVAHIPAYIFHYGWVKTPATMKKKIENFHKLWHSDNWIEKNLNPEDLFDFSAINSLKLYDGTAPKVMQARIKKHNMNFNIGKKKFPLKDRILYWYEKTTGHRPFEYKNYVITKVY